MPTPVLVNTRTPMSLQAERMHRVEKNIAKIDQQIATGERLTAPSDDPAAANRIATLKRLMGELDAQKNSIERATSRLGLAETAMDAGYDILVRARDLALSAANGTMNADNRLAVLGEVRVLKEQLLDASNLRDENGRYLFAGATDGAPAYQMDEDGVVSWAGFGHGPGNTGLTSASGATPRGPDVFGSDADGAFAAIDRLIAALEEPDNLLRPGAFAETLDRLDSSVTAISNAEAVLGANMARLDAERERIVDYNLQAEVSMTALNGLDMTKAIVQLQTLQLTLSAAQGSFVNIYSHTLFDRLA